LDRTRRDRLASFVLLPFVLVAVGVLAYFTFRTTIQIEKLRQQSVLEATLGLATEKADRLDKQIVEQDNVVTAIADPTHLPELTDRWLPTAQRETPTVRAILVLDDANDVLAFASRAGGAWADEEAFRRLLVQKMLGDMELGAQPMDELRHLHRAYGGQSYLVSYWQKMWQGRRYLVVAWHDIGRIVKYVLPSLYESAGASSPSSRVNVVDEEGRLIFGPSLRSGQFTVGVRFPTTLYGWRLQVSPIAAEELASRVQNRRSLELAMVGLSCIVIVAGVATILLAAEKERRISALKSEFVANVSHELKTPLALVRMFGEMLQSGRVASEAKRQEYLSIIVNETERLSGLIENVLDFAKVERGRGSYEFAEGDVGESVARAATVYRYRAEREGVELLVDVETGLAAKIDDRAIQLAVINLIDNALKYAPNGKEIRVRAGREGSDIAIRVSDSGPGVPAEDRERIFERFVRGTPPQAAATTAQASEKQARPVRGSGIGLALVKHIAESHGGRAWVDASGRDAGRSQLEGGTSGATFVMTIPGQPSQGSLAS
jgi:two-component system phosphate regulon sensor histidine kinase PhoR